MPKYSDLGDLSNAIIESSNKRNQEENNWFANNPPLKEFKIQRGDDDYVEYGVWIVEEDFLIFYKITPTSKYSFRHRIVIEKEIVKELYPLLERKEDDTNKTSS